MMYLRFDIFCAGLVPGGGVLRQYYIAAERHLWDHIPLQADACSGALQPLEGDNAARAFNNVSASNIGSKRWRASFFEYTGANFTTRKVRPANQLLKERC